MEQAKYFTFLLGKAYKNPTKLKIKEENNTSGKERRLFFQKNKTCIQFPVI